MGANAAATFGCDNLDWVRKTKMAPQNYGAIHTKEKVFASGIESSKFHRTPTHPHYQRPIYGTSPLRMFDSAQAISNRSSLTKSRPKSVSEAGRAMVAVLAIFTLWLCGAAMAASMC